MSSLHHFPERSGSATAISLGDITARYEQIFNNLYESVYVVNWSGEIVYANQTMEEITGYSRSELYGHRCCENILSRFNHLGDGQCPETCPVQQGLKAVENIDTNIWLVHRSGDRLPFTMRVIPIVNGSGEVDWAAIILKDRSPAIKAEKWVDEFKKLAHLDHLTDIPNRRNIEISLMRRFQEWDRYGWSLGILFVDIDHFKNLNDTHGHGTGDEVLKLVATTLQERQRPFDILGRWGGEEFVVMVLNVSEEQLTVVAERLRSAIENLTLKTKETRIPLTISVGGTLIRKDDTPESIIERADNLMYQSKQAGRNRVTIG